MSRFIVEGGTPLSGVIEPAGNKNEALPILAASMLTAEPVKISNTPGIGDVQTMLTVLEACGAKVTRFNNHTYTIEAQDINTETIPEDQAAKIRASIVLLAPLLVRCGSVKLPIPGGDRIGRRRVDTHLWGFKALGANFEAAQRYYHVWRDGPLQGADILLDEASVTATENLVMAAVFAEGQSTISNAASEPHVQQLCLFLNSLGANISGIGSNVLTIEGVQELKGGSHRIAADYLEVGSFIGCAAVTGGSIRIRNANPHYLRMVLHRFERLGIRVQCEGDDILVPQEQPMKISPDLHTSMIKIDDGPWPAFPADMTSIATVIATQVEGTVMIFEKMFESRLFFVDRLISMGANIILCDPHRAVVVGPSKLYGHAMSSPDIRAGMALVMAALCAEGMSDIQNIEQIDRGYERLDERLSQLGARIQRVE